MPWATREKAREYQRKYNARPGESEKRTERDRARTALIREYGKEKVQGMEVDHIVPLDKGGSGTARSNLRLLTPHKNRGFKRDRYGNAIG